MLALLVAPICDMTSTCILHRYNKKMIYDTILLGYMRKIKCKVSICHKGPKTFFMNTEGFFYIKIFKAATNFKRTI